MKLKKGDVVSFNCPYDTKTGTVVELLESEGKVRIQTSISKWTVKTTDIIENFGKVK